MFMANGLFNASSLASDFSAANQRPIFASLLAQNNEAVDECNTTQQCKDIYGEQATDCLNSQSAMSVCFCDDTPCRDLVEPQPEPEPEPQPEPEPNPTPNPRPRADQASTTPIIVSLLLEQNDSTTPVATGAFIEQDGLLVVEMESLGRAEGWSRRAGSGAIGSYYEWLGQNSFGVPGRGLISFQVAISNPGTYRFIWRSSIRNGTDPTEHNDSWLKILANNFYAKRNSGGTTTIVCPREKPASNRCIGGSPNGSSGDGWFKIYRSGGPAADWFWQSFTSDNNAHSVFADFDRAGSYEIQISGRSQNHGIDRMVLFRSDNASGNVTQAFATDAARPESLRTP